MWNWWNSLPRWAQQLLAAIPSVVLEFVSGVAFFALGLGVAWLCWRSQWWVGSSGGAFRSKLVLGIAVGFAHVLSFLYELTFDPNGWSWADVLEREPGIVTAMLLWWYLA